MGAANSEKVICSNPNSGREIQIDASIYHTVREAIEKTLKQNKDSLTYSEIVKGVKKSFQLSKAKFQGSLEWYVVTIKQDMVAKGIIDTWLEKGSRLHKLNLNSQKSG
jgi:hypothetical protein